MDGTGQPVFAAVRRSDGDALGPDGEIVDIVLHVAVEADTRIVG